MRCLDLFSGIGGFALACEWAGIETVAFCEINHYCQRVLRKHWPSVPIYYDVRELHPEHLTGPVDLVCGGFPCQPYSVVGQRKGAADDRDLWPEMLRCVREFRPAWVCGENVAGFVGMGLDSCLADLEGEGYETRAFLVPALAVGTHHRRQRLFVVAHSERYERGVQPESGISEETILTGNDGATRTVADAGLQCAGTERGPAGNASSERDQAPSVIAKRSQSDGGAWSTEPNVGRVAYGVPSRVDRLRTLGNAVVPQQVYPILRAIKEVHDRRVRLGLVVSRTEVA